MRMLYKHNNWVLIVSIFSTFVWDLICVLLIAEAEDMRITPVCVTVVKKQVMSYMG